MNSFLDLNFDVIHAATKNRYVDNNDIRLVNLGSVALFSNHQLTSSSEKHLEDINHAHIVWLLYKLLTSSRRSDDLFIGFDRDRDRRRRELRNKKHIKGNFRVRIFLKDIFDFAEHQQKGTFGLGYRLTLTRSSDNAVLNKDNAISIGKFKINAIEWYVPHYSPSLDQQRVLTKQIVDKTPTRLHYRERSVFMKEVNTQNFWTFELGTQEGIKNPIWIFTVFRKSDREHDQILKNDTFLECP